MDNWKFLLDTINTVHNSQNRDEHVAMILVSLAYVMAEKEHGMAEGRLHDLARQIREKE